MRLFPDELASKFKTEKETPYTRWVKAEGLDIIPSFYVRNLRTVALAKGAPRGSASLLNHDARALERLLRDGDSAGQEPARTGNYTKRWFSCSAAAFFDHGLERCRRADHIRMEGRRAVRDPAELSSPAFQRIGARAGALRRGDECAAGH